MTQALPGASPAFAPPVPARRPGALRRWRAVLRQGPLASERMLRSAGVRFGVIYAGLFGVSALALAVFLWWSTAGVLERQTNAAINADSQGLSDRYGDSGMLALIETIDQRLAGNVDDDAIYLLTDPAFHRLAGNLERWPPGVTMDREWAELQISRAGIRGLARVRQFELDGGYHLLIGRDIEARAQMRRLLTDAMLWSAAIAVVLGMFGAWAVRRLFGMTIADVSATAAAISGGDLTRRVRVTGHGDEFDDLAETINDMLERIARLMDGVRQVSNAIAHDLRTPIARARARLEDAATHARGEADLRAAIERAQADLDGVTSVFQALLRIAEIEAGARRSAFAPFDLAPVLSDLAEFYGAVAEDRGLALRAEIAESLPTFGDRDMLQQAVANLLDNAVKFSPPDSAVVVTARTDAQGTCIAVADQGPGIPEADRGRATDRFFRGEDARSTPGSGLGLALVQAVAHLHGGSLKLEDNQPGLRAVLDLPIHAEGAV
jgi:signal transduction histidine kinase